MPEIIVPLSAPRHEIRPLTDVRSTLLVSSLRSIRARGLFERYLGYLADEHHDMVRSVIAGMWLPIPVLLAHYQACDALALSAREQVEIGREVGAAVQGTILGTMVKMAKGAGVTPWTIFGQYQKLWDRLMRGGGIVVTKLGPKEVTFEYVNISLVAVPYFRGAFRGVNIGACELFSNKVYAVEIPTLCTDSSLGIRLSWA